MPGILLVTSPLAASLPSVWALNQRVYPLDEVIKSSAAITRARVAAVDAKNQRLAFHVGEPFKGSLPFAWMDVDLRPGGWTGPDALLRRVAPGLPVVLFASKIRDRHVVLVFTEGTWFQVSATDAAEKNRLAWTLTRGDPYLRRTFPGKTTELETILAGVLAGKQKAPEPNMGANGLGPEIPADYKPPQPPPSLPPFLAARYGGNAPAPANAAAPAGDLSALPAAVRAEAEALAKEFSQPPATVAALFRQAKNNGKDVRMALTLARDHGRGGNRAWVRSPAEILTLKQASDRLTWLDIKGCLQRAGELFRPVDDSALLIHRLRQQFTWDELDPLFNDDKWQKRKLDDVIAQWRKERLPHPLLPGERVHSAVHTARFGRVGDGGPQMDSVGWAQLPGSPGNLVRRQYAWDGRDAAAPQAPGRQTVRAPGGTKPEMPNRPPRPGLALAGGAGTYDGASLWFANGLGDYAGQNVSHDGTFAYCDAGWVVTPPGASRSFLIDLQIYAPDHSDNVGEPRDGWYNGARRGSRYAAVGLRLADGSTRTAAVGPPHLLVNVETAPDRWDRVLLRVDVKPGFVSLIAFVAGVGEVARASAKVDGKAGVAVAPLLGLRRVSEGFLPEFYLGSLKIAPIGQPALTIAKGDLKVPPAPPAPPAAPAPQAVPGDDAVARLVRTGPAPRRVALVIDHSGSMQPHLPRARELARQILAALSPKDSALIVAMNQQMTLFGDYLPVTEKNLARLTAHLDQIGAGSGGDYGQMLEKVLPTRPTHVVLIGDGDPPSRGIMDSNALFQLRRERNVARSTLYVVAIGSGGELPGDNFTRRLAESTGGQALRVRP